VGKTRHQRAGRPHVGIGKPPKPGQPPAPGRLPTAGNAFPEAFLRGRRSLRLVFLAGLTFLTLLPFAGKAFHIDDPLFVWAAKNIASKPLNPYGFDVNWYGIPMRMSDVTKNPPLTSYYIAGFARVFGWAERPLHLAFLIPAIVVIIGTYLLAERLCSRPLLATLCTLFTPVFLVSSSDIMSDTLMLALWVSAVYLWITGLKKGSAVRLLLSGLLVALSAVAKYFGMALIPRLFLYTLLERRRLTWTAVYLLLPVVILAAYQWATHALYGRGLLLDAASYATDRPPQWWKSFDQKFLIGLAFTGGCLGAVCVFTLWTWRRWALAAGAAVAVTIALTIAATGSIGDRTFRSGEGNLWATAGLFGVFAVGGLGVVGLSIAEIWRRRDAESWLLSLWVVGTFVFAAVVNWTTNGRSILPMIPAGAILIMRRLELRGGRGPTAAQTGAIGVAAVVVALGVAWADFAYANSARVAAERINSKYGGGTAHLWFEGHWGFQYYMEALGGKAIDVQKTRAMTGDFLVVPDNNTNVYAPPKESASLVETLEVPSSRWIATMRRDLGAGFYADEWGPLPFVVGKVPPERYQIFRVLMSGGQ